MKTRLRDIEKLILRHWRDILIAILLGIAFSYASYRGAKLVPEAVLHSNNFDVWFDGDMPRVYADMTSREGDHERIKTHPLFLLATHPIVHVLNRNFGFEPIVAVRLVIACVAFLWMFSFFVLLRLMGCYRLDTVILCLLAAVSASSIFWFTVPETFSFSSLSILFALLIVTLSEQYVLPLSCYIVVNILTFGLTITNWMAGILASLLNHSFRRTLDIASYTFCIVTLLWGIQKYIYPTATFFLGEGDYRANWNFFNPQSGNSLHVVISFFYHTLIMPAIQEVFKLQKAQWLLQETQFSLPGSASPWGMLAVILWSILLILGIGGLRSLKNNRKLRIFLTLMLIGQLGLHILYGDETFLYSLHFIVLLIPLVALSVLTKFRRLVLVFAIFLIPCVGMNNIQQFNKARNFFTKHNLSLLRQTTDTALE